MHQQNKPRQRGNTFFFCVHQPTVFSRFVWEQTLVGETTATAIALAPKRNSAVKPLFIPTHLYEYRIFFRHWT